MQANAFLPCALIQLAKASSAEKTVAVNHAETAHPNRDAASTRLSAYPAHAKEENAEPTAAEVLAEHARKDIHEPQSADTTLICAYPVRTRMNNSGNTCLPLCS